MTQSSHALTMTTRRSQTMTTRRSQATRGCDSVQETMMQNMQRDLSLSRPHSSIIIYALFTRWCRTAHSFRRRQIVVIGPRTCTASVLDSSDGAYHYALLSIISASSSSSDESPLAGSIKLSKNDFFFSAAVGTGDPSPEIFMSAASRDRLSAFFASFASSCSQKDLQPKLTKWNERRRTRSAIILSSSGL